MRTNSELLQVFLDNRDYFESGLCQWLVTLIDCKIITKDEGSYLEDLFDKTLPENMAGSIYSIYSWGKGVIEPRIKFLKRVLVN